MAAWYNVLGYAVNKLDLNLLLALDVLLVEESVVRAAERLQLSPSAMSRTLSRLRAATCDPLLVRAGRRLVPTPRAIELRDRVGQVVKLAHNVLSPQDELELRSLEASFTLCTSDGFVENFGAPLLTRIAGEAPGVRLRFIPKLNARGVGLRDGSVDLETGVIHNVMRPEVRAQALFRDRFIGVVRDEHALTRAEITAERYAAEKHVTGPRSATERAPIDDALAELGLERQCVAIVTGFGGALALVRGSDLVAAVPERHTANMRGGLFTFPLPFSTPAVAVSLLWHPRRDADPAHRWLRTCIQEVVQV